MSHKYIPLIHASYPQSIAISYKLSHTHNRHTQNSDTQVSHLIRNKISHYNNATLPHLQPDAHADNLPSTGCTIETTPLTHHSDNPLPAIPDHT